MTRSPLHALTLGLAVGLCAIDIVFAAAVALWLAYENQLPYACVAVVLGFAGFWTLRWVWNHYQLGET